MLSFLTSTGGKILGGLLLTVMLGGGLTVAIQRHDKAVLAMAQVSEDKAIAAARSAAAAHEIAALATQQTQLEALQATSANLKVQTHAVTKTLSCAASPAVRVLLGSVRGNRGSN